MEKIIREAEPFCREGENQNHTGCLLIHGFTGTPQSMRPMGEYIAQQGITARGVRLEGHGTSVEDMSQTRYQDWIASAEEGLRELSQKCDKVFVSGLSMGGTITMYLAHGYPELVSGIIPICAPIEMRGLKMSLVPLLKHLIKTVPGVSNHIKDPAAYEVAYERMPLKSIHELIRLTARVRELLPEITRPALVFASREDKVVPPENARHIKANLGSNQKELLWLENSYHVATLDYDREYIFKQSVAFMKKHSFCSQKNNTTAQDCLS